MNDSKQPSILWLLPGRPTDFVLHVAPALLVLAVIWKIWTGPFKPWISVFSLAHIPADPTRGLPWLWLAAMLALAYLVGFAFRFVVVPRWPGRTAELQGEVVFTDVVHDPRVIREFLTFRSNAAVFPGQSCKLPEVRKAVECLTASDGGPSADCLETCAKVEKALAKWFPADVSEGEEASADRTPRYDISGARMSPDLLQSCLEEIRGRYFAQFREDFLPVIERRDLAECLAAATMVAAVLLSVAPMRVLLGWPTLPVPDMCWGLILVAFAVCASFALRRVARNEHVALARSVIRALGVWH